MIYIPINNCEECPYHESMKFFETAYQVCNKVNSINVSDDKNIFFENCPFQVKEDYQNE